MNFELQRTFQLSAEHTMRLTQALAPLLAEWGLTYPFSPQAVQSFSAAREEAAVFPLLEK